VRSTRSERFHASESLNCRRRPDEPFRESGQRSRTECKSVSRRQSVWFLESGQRSRTECKSVSRRQSVWFLESGQRSRTECKSVSRRHRLGFVGYRQSGGVASWSRVRGRVCACSQPRCLPLVVHVVRVAGPLAFALAVSHRKIRGNRGSNRRVEPGILTGTRGEAIGEALLLLGRRLFERVR